MGGAVGQSYLMHVQITYYRILLQEAFLPQGYPASVSDDYLAYQIWDTVQV